MKNYLFLILVSINFFAFGQEQPPDDLSGNDLRQWLKTNWYTGKFSNQGYNGARFAMYSNIDKEADGKVYCVYTGFNQNSAETTFLNPINAEHTIPQSWFDSNEPMKSDIFHLYPSHGSVNSARSNKPFNEVDDNTTNTWYTGNANGISTSSSIPTTGIDNYSENRTDSFEPREDHKGDVARAAFYFFTMYDISATSGKTLNSVILNNNIDILYEWHINDPADDREKQRNERIEDVQGNRNPYIDYPDLACKAWGFNCSNTPSPSITLQQSITSFDITSINGQSKSQNYEIVGQDMVGNLTVTASSHFKISADDQSFVNSLTISPNSGDINTTIFIRFQPTGSAEGIITGNISHSAANLTSVNLVVSGEVQEIITPQLIITETLADFGVVTFGSVSQSQKYLVRGENLMQALNITVSDHFQVSLDDETFDQQLTIQQVNGTFTDEVFVRFEPKANLNTAVLGTIIHSYELEDVVIDLIGAELNENIATGITVEEELNDFGKVLLGETSDVQTYVVSGGQMTGDLNISASEGFQVSKDGNTFTESLTISRSGDLVNQTVVYAQFKPVGSTLADISGTLTHSASGYENVDLRVSGTSYEIVIIAPKISFDLDEVLLTDFTSQTVYIVSDAEVTEALNLSLVLANASNISYGTNGFITEPPIVNGLLNLTMPFGQDSIPIIFVFNTNFDPTKTFDIDLSILSGQGFGLGENSKLSLKYDKGSTILSIWSKTTPFYPNPAIDVIYLYPQLNIGKIEISDLSGKIVNFFFDEDQHMLKLPELKSGIYLMKYIIGTNHFTHKLLITN